MLLVLKYYKEKQQLVITFIVIDTWLVYSGHGITSGKFDSKTKHQDKIFF